MRGMRSVLLTCLLGIAGCLSPSRQTSFPHSQQQLVAKQLLEFHEDRFLLEHNEKLAACWRNYVEARQHLADLWKASRSTVYSQPDRERRAQAEIRQAKADLMQAAGLLQRLSREMAGEADRLVQAAERIPPRLQNGRR